MNSTEFIEYKPTLDVNDALKILSDHGIYEIGEGWVGDPDNGIDDQQEFWGLGKSTNDGHIWNTQDVFDWLGY